MSSCSALTDKDRERDRAPSPAMPIPAEIRAHYMVKRLEDEQSARIWVRTTVFPVLRQFDAYTSDDSSDAVSMKRKFAMPSGIDAERVKHVAFGEIERKMIGFRVKHLEVIRGHPKDLLDVELVEDIDATAISSDIEKKITDSFAPPYCPPGMR